MSQSKNKAERKKVRREARRQLEDLIRLSFFVRLRLAWRLVRGR